MPTKDKPVNKQVGSFTVIEVTDGQFEVRQGDRLLAIRDSEERATRVAEAAGQGPVNLPA